MADRFTVLIVVIFIGVVLGDLTLWNNHIENTKYDFKSNPDSELQYLEGNGTHILEWAVKNYREPTHYQITVDGKLNKNNSWNGSNIVIYIYELQLDESPFYNPHTVTCKVFDNTQGELVHSVQVNVVSKIEQQFDILERFMITAGFVLVIAAAISIVVAVIKDQTSK